VVACLSLDARETAVPVTLVSTTSDLRYIASNAGPRTVVCSDRYVSRIERALSDTALQLRIAAPIVDVFFAVAAARGTGHGHAPRFRKRHAARSSLFII
jgi:hypothetical protein